MSLFILRNHLGAKMKKGIRNFCNNDDSTSTLNQHHVTHIEVVKNSATSTASHNNPSLISSSPPKTLEEMILQLELEEEIARKTRSFAGGDGDETPEVIMHHRMSCVNNSDILRSARNALNQYPRFSLDGKDAMYRSSFRNSSPAINFARGRRDGELTLRRRGRGDRAKCLPTMLAGERVIWCKPGVVAKLMGLEAMPVPLFAKKSNDKPRKERLSSVMRRQSLRKMTERREMERRRLLVMEEINGGCGGGIRRENHHHISSASAYGRPGGGYCAMKPVPVVDPVVLDRKSGWPNRRFV